MNSWENIIRAANHAWLRANGLTPAGPEVGSPLWNRLLKPYEYRCTECGQMTENYDADNGDWCCDDCRAEIVRGQEEDHRLDDPRHGQARDINRYRYEP